MQTLFPFEFGAAFVEGRLVRCLLGDVRRAICLELSFFFGQRPPLFGQPSQVLLVCDYLIVELLQLL
jgi:hypothetical protein